VNVGAEMGILWTVWPLDDEMKSWLDETGVDYPKEPSRFPTGREIKEVIAGLQEFDIKINDNGIGSPWQASIVSKSGGDSGEWTLLNIQEYSGDDEQQKLWFEKGWESLIASILREITKSCGPLVLIADCGGEPQVIFTAI